MELTGSFIRVGSGLSLIFLGAASLFFLRRAWNVFSNLEELKNEFESLHQKAQEEFYEKEFDLLNLSFTYRALRKQLERNRKVDKELLDQALKKAKQKRKIFSINRAHNLYYAASKKLSELRSEAKN